MLFVMTSCCNDKYNEIVNEPVHRTINIINNSADSIKIEWDTNDYMDFADSLFSASQIIGPNSFAIRTFSRQWDMHFARRASLRLFVFDKAYSAPRDYGELGVYQNEHLILKKWYTKDELIEMDWRIIYE